MYSSGRYVSEIAQVLGVSRPTVYKALNQNEMAIA
jgi:excisionase family DNA binding protein